MNRMRVRSAIAGLAVVGSLLLPAFSATASTKDMKFGSSGAFGYSSKIKQMHSGDDVGGRVFITPNSRDNTFHGVWLGPTTTAWLNRETGNYEYSNSVHGKSVYMNARKQKYTLGTNFKRYARIRVGMNTSWQMKSEEYGARVYYNYNWA